MHDSLWRFKTYVEYGLLREVISPCGKLVLWNYTDKCVFEKAWDDVTLNARGTVYEIETGRVVARAFPKFFNFGELETYKQKELLKQTDFEVYEKMDGCFTHGTKLNLWGGGTIKIGDVVNKKLTPTLIGMDKDGNLVPTKVIDWHKNGKKTIGWSSN